MTRYVFKMPDLGEGTVEAEVVAWHVKVGDLVTEETVIAEVMTEKAAVEVPSPVAGRVVSITGAPGDMVRVGAELIVFETETADDEPAPAPVPSADAARGPANAAPAASDQPGAGTAAKAVANMGAGSAQAATGAAKRHGRVMASPATRRRRP